jgi:hypothetical protein
VTEQQIREHAERFRRCLEELQPQLGVSFERFPYRSCGDSSNLLGEWLTEQGVSGLEYVCGEFDHEKSHAWLELDGLIIDITPDLFEAGPGPVYVGESQSFHSQLKEQSRRPHYLDDSIKSQYRLCKQWMEAESDSQ